MFCMKCGREVDEGQLFCTECLEVMKRYPVKPGIAIQLPHREEAPLIKKTLSRRKPVVSAEEQVRSLKRRLRRLFGLWLVTLLLLAATIYPTIKFLQGINIVLPGQNYSTFTETVTTEP